MTRVIQISDLHFGRIVDGLPDCLVKCIEALKPEAVVVTGDITQRARQMQFLQAKKFLRRLPKPLMLVPGNHDVPLFNLPVRFLFPLFGFNYFLSKLSTPLISLPNVMVVPINSTKRLTVDCGRVKTRDLERAASLFAQAAPGTLKMALLHHPVALPAELDAHMLLENAQEVIEAFAAMNVDFLLSGHTHRPYATVIKTASGEKRMISITANTATSSRVRGYGNSFFVFDLLPNQLELTEHVYADSRECYVPAMRTCFVKDELGNWALKQTTAIEIQAPDVNAAKSETPSLDQEI